MLRTKLRQAPLRHPGPALGCPYSGVDSLRRTVRRGHSLRDVEQDGHLLSVLAYPCCRKFHMSLCPEPTGLDVILHFAQAVLFGGVGRRVTDNQL